MDEGRKKRSGFSLRSLVVPFVYSLIWSGFWILGFCFFGKGQRVGNAFIP